MREQWHLRQARARMVYAAWRSSPLHRNVQPTYGPSRGYRRPQDDIIPVSHLYSVRLNNGIAIPSVTAAKIERNNMSPHTAESVVSFSSRHLKPSTA